MNDYVTAIGLDVHARSIKACALNPMSRRSGAPRSATTRRGRRVGAPSGAQGGLRVRRHRLPPLPGPARARPGLRRQRGLQDAAAAAGQGRKTDRRDAEFLARLLATPGTSRVWVPGRPDRAARDLSRALADAATTCARQAADVSSCSGTGVFRRDDADGRAQEQLDARVLGWADAIVRRARRRGGLRAYRDCVRRCQEAATRWRGGWQKSAGRPVEAGRRRAQVRQGDRRRHRLPARLRGRRLLEVHTAPEFASWVRPGALGALEAARPRRGGSRAQATPTCARPRRGGLARAGVIARAKPLAPGAEVAPAVGRSTAAKCSHRLQDRRRRWRRPAGPSSPAAPRRARWPAGCGR